MRKAQLKVQQKKTQRKRIQQKAPLSKLQQPRNDALFKANTLFFKNQSQELLYT
jgi:hypothetical protein